MDPVALLEQELGASRLVLPSSEKIEAYATDYSFLGRHEPTCAVVCDDAEQVQTVLRLASEHGFPIIPRGAGSGMVGGALATSGGVILSTEKMNRIIDIDEKDMVCVVEPGVITENLQNAVEEHGMFYPPDPASLSFCSIGGNAATNAGGPRAFKYGVTREYILGLDVTLMGGEQLSLGRRTAKGVTGYDLVGTFVGSEGTFGVTTELTVKLIPKPAKVETFLAVFKDVRDAATAISNLLRQGFRPRTLEVADKLSVDLVRPKTSYKFPQNTGAIALIELDGERDGLEASMLRAGELCMDAGALDVLVAQDEKERRRLWEARRNISEALRESCKHKINEDVCVPRGALLPLLDKVAELSDEFSIPIAAFGHAGDGNIHVNLLVKDDMNDPEVKAHIDRALTKLFRETCALNGTLSGEHGIGESKREYVSIEQPQNLIAWQHKLKTFWDPKNLLNPGKMLPTRQSCHE